MGKTLAFTKTEIYSGESGKLIAMGVFFLKLMPTRN